MDDTVRALVDLDRKERLRLETDRGRTMEARVNQRGYEVDGHLRLELAIERDDGRYQLRSQFDGGDWTPVELRRADHTAPDWTALGSVVSVESLGDSRMMDSLVEIGHEG